MYIDQPESELDSLREWSKSLQDEKGNWDLKKVSAIENTEDWHRHCSSCFYEHLDPLGAWADTGFADNHHCIHLLSQEDVRYGLYPDYPVTKTKAEQLGLPVYPDSHGSPYYYCSDIIKALGMHPKYLGHNPFRM